MVRAVVVVVVVVVRVRGSPDVFSNFVLQLVSPTKIVLRQRLVGSRSPSELDELDAGFSARVFRR